MDQIVRDNERLATLRDRLVGELPDERKRKFVLRKATELRQLIDDNVRDMSDDDLDSNASMVSFLRAANPGEASEYGLTVGLGEQFAEALDMSELEEVEELVRKELP